MCMCIYIDIYISLYFAHVIRWEYCPCYTMGVKKGEKITMCMCIYIYILYFALKFSAILQLYANQNLYLVQKICTFAALLCKVSAVMFLLLLCNFSQNLAFALQKQKKYICTFAALLCKVSAVMFLLFCAMSCILIQLR